MVFVLKYIHLIWPILSVLSKEALNLDLSIWSLLVFFFFTLVHFFSKDILLKSNMRKYCLIKMFWNLCREKFPVAVFAAVFCKVFWHLTRIPLRRTSLAFSWSGVKFWIHSNYHFHEIWIWWTHYQVSGGILSVSIVVNNILAYLYISHTCQLKGWCKYNFWSEKCIPKVLEKGKGWTCKLHKFADTTLMWEWFGKNVSCELVSSPL